MTTPRWKPPSSKKTLSMSAQQLLAMAIREHQRKLDLQFERRVRNETKTRVDEIILHWKQQLTQAQKLFDARRALMDKATFNEIRHALPPDARWLFPLPDLGQNHIVDLMDHRTVWDLET